MRREDDGGDDSGDGAGFDGDGGSFSGGVLDADRDDDLHDFVVFDEDDLAVARARGGWSPESDRYDSDFVSDVSAAEDEDGSEEAEDEWVLCECGATADDGSAMVRCGNPRCEVWQHATCVDVDAEEAARPSFAFFCARCDANGRENAPEPPGKPSPTTRAGRRTQKTNPPPKKTNDPGPRAGPRGVEPETLTIGLAGEDNRGASRGRPRGGRPVPPRGVLAERARPAVRGDARARGGVRRARGRRRAPGNHRPPRDRARPRPRGGQKVSRFFAPGGPRGPRAGRRDALEGGARSSRRPGRGPRGRRGGDPRRDGASVPGAGAAGPVAKSRGRRDARALRVR